MHRLVPLLILISACSSQKPTNHEPSISLTCTARAVRPQIEGEHFRFRGSDVIRSDHPFDLDVIHLEAGQAKTLHSFTYHPSKHSIFAVTPIDHPSTPKLEFAIFKTVSGTEDHFSISTGKAKNVLQGYAARFEALRKPRMFPIFNYYLLYMDSNTNLNASHLADYESMLRATETESCSILILSVQTQAPN